MIASEDDAPIASDLFPDWRRLLGEPARCLELEIGPGHGAFALAFARAHPDRALVAIEQRRSFAAALEARARARGQENLLAIHGDARIIAPRLFREGELAAVHVHFPDPWWKRRHRARRLVDGEMGLLLLRLLAPGGLLDLRTDVEAYAREAAPRLEAVGFRNEDGPGAFSGPPPGDIASSRERRYLAAGQAVWRLRLRRPG